MPTVPVILEPVVLELSPEVEMSGAGFMSLVPLVVDFGDELTLLRRTDFYVNARFRIRLSVILSRLRNMVMGPAEVEINARYEKTAVPPESAQPSDCTTNTFSPAVVCRAPSTFTKPTVKQANCRPCEGQE